MYNFLHRKFLHCVKLFSVFQLADHTSTLSTDSVSVQVYVCAKMRAKIVSEVNVNIDLLQVSDDL